MIIRQSEAELKKMCDIPNPIYTRDMICNNAQQQCLEILRRLQLPKPFRLCEGHMFLLNWNFPGLFPKVPNPSSERESFMQTEQREFEVSIPTQILKKVKIYLNHIVDSYSPQLPDAVNRPRLGTSYHCGLKKCRASVSSKDAVWLHIPGEWKPFCSTEHKDYFVVHYDPTSLPDPDL